LRGASKAGFDVSASFSEEKEAKRLFLIGASGVSTARVQVKKVFCAAFFQKSGFLTL
jgi:hypothetical protein